MLLDASSLGRRYGNQLLTYNLVVITRRRENDSVPFLDDMSRQRTAILFDFPPVVRSVSTGFPTTLKKDLHAITIVGRLTRYRWNLSVKFYGIIPSNPLAPLGRARQKRNHGRIVPEKMDTVKRNHSEHCRGQLLRQKQSHARAREGQRLNFFTVFS